MSARQEREREARESFDTYYAASATRLISAVFAVTGNLADAEDAVQEAYARAWLRWDRLCAEGDPAPWIRTVALRLAVSTWRKARNRLRAQFRHGPPPDVPALAPDRVALIEAVRALPADQRKAIVLHHLLDLPVAQVARELGATETAIRTRLSRARKALAVRLDGPAQDPAAPAGPRRRTPAHRNRKGLPSA
ncbi:SigE family RNA polymerase sigma factor [Streptomyces cheonanensis]|uniref:SigE family RNA polymerase sigma factor n=1 Tax=Streptomyces cheonanensis TaxID=312720 RepID=A0ABP5GR69_9ACTN|nr:MULTISPECIES: SigE family RNA polymerase sigma factor [Streptomyces]QKV70948.1 SigE family RNA polymerase sigma factor [Streptomyces harbinensis]